MTSPSGAAGPALRVLLVDDSPDTRLVIRAVLTRTANVEIVAEAADGAEGIALAARHQPDLVVLDLVMPVLGGLEALPRVREAAPGCRVVVLSSLSAEHAPRALEAGAAVYVEKGSPPAVLARDILSGVDLLDTVVTALRPPEAEAHFPADPTSPSRARAFARDVLHDWSEDTALETVELLLSELVTNAVVHADSDPNVALRLLPDRVHVEVTDNMPDTVAVTEADDDGESGRGLGMIDALAMAWGSTPTPTGKIVWFDVAREKAS